jgi:hypothetical protein
MSIGSLGIVGGLAGTPLPQRAADADKTQRETVEQQRAAQASEQAENAAGIGQTEEDSQTSERDADGRRLWEEQRGTQKKPSDQAADEPHSQLAKDPGGDCGGLLDVVG